MADFDTANIYQRLMKLVKYGNIHSVQADPPSCRVTFGTDPISGQEHISDWLNWSTRSDSEVNDWSMPAVGAQVMVFSPGGETDNGLVFPAGFSGDRAPPATEPGQHVTAYSDGASVAYDTQAHAMAVNLPAGGSIVIVTPGGMKVKGNVDIDGVLTATDVKDKTGSMQQMRDTHNLHDHNENGDGGGVTDPPNQKMQATMPTDEEEPDQ
ncbi:phage baseplate assembly protein V [Lelliottia sp. SL45]|uniref:phage baseplate assembly protein V n=1 Tax=Lelliottia sp. SL45 TaxID=2994665 RepID=UPI002272E232|nr:phage baseplate assembly protein V [Lelliottia sp. SL45]MCY1699477.1 phage baseplate assembly protein V [Lelliottia sp. SL45]